MRKLVEFWESPKEQCDRVYSTRIDSFKTIWKSFGIEEAPVKPHPAVPMDEERMRKLLRFKRHETPSEDYFEAFLKEFHLRQRQDLLKRSSVSIFFERINTYLSDPHSQGWAYAPVLGLFITAFYIIIGMTADSPMPEVPSLADVPALQAQYALSDGEIETSVWTRPFAPMHTVDVPPTHIQAAAFITPRLQLPLLNVPQSFEESMQLIGN